MTSTKISEKQFFEELEVRGFKVINGSIGRPVFPCCEAYEAYLRQYNKERTPESKDEFYKLIDGLDIKIEECMTYRLDDVIHSIRHKTNTLGMVVDCLMDYCSPEERFRCITPHT